MKIIPNAGNNAVAGQENGLWKIRIKAPPEKGKANQELIAFLAEVLDIPKSRVHIESGETARKKRISIDGLTEDEFNAKMAEKKSHKKAK